MQLISSITFLLVAAGVLAQSPDPMIDTPSNVVSCQPQALTFSGTHGPFLISITPGGSTSPIIEQLPSVTVSPVTWVADIAEGTSVTFNIKDSTGVTHSSAIVTIQPNPAGDKTCIGKNNAGGNATSISGIATGSGSPASTSPVSISSAASSPSTPGTSASAAKPASSGSAGAASSGTAAASAATASKSSAALSLTSGSASGIIGMLLAALLV